MASEEKMKEPQRRQLELAVYLFRRAGEFREKTDPIHLALVGESGRTLCGLDVIGSELAAVRWYPEENERCVSSTTQPVYIPEDYHCLRCLAEYSKRKEAMTT